MNNIKMASTKPIKENVHKCSQNPKLVLNIPRRQLFHVNCIIYSAHTNLTKIASTKLNYECLGSKNALLSRLWT